MTQDEIIAMARQAEKYADLQVSDTDMDIWERTVYLQFAKLVAAKEREACAKVCESTKPTVHNSYECNGYECAELIRARGEA